MIFDHRFVDDDTSSKHSESTGVKAVGARFNYCYFALLMIRVAVGSTKIDSMRISDMVLTKNSHRFIIALFLFPFLAIFCILVASVFPYHACNSCESFLEVPIAGVSVFKVQLDFSINLQFPNKNLKLFCTVLYSIIFSRMLFVAFKYAAKDEHGIETEFGLTIIIISPIITLGFLLLITDPNNWDQLRQFYWGWIFFICYFFSWWILFGNQIYQQWRSDSAKVNSKIEVRKMRSVCQENPEIKKQFHEYAKKQYVTEMINFMEDVAKYKELYFEKVSSYA